MNRKLSGYEIIAAMSISSIITSGTISVLVNLGFTLANLP